MKSRTPFVVSLALCAILSSLASDSMASALAKPFSQLVAFSGALSDTGNYAAVHGNYPSPFYKNRTTNGPVAIDVLAARLGLKSDPSLHLVGPAVGTNFAVKDALASGNGPDDLPEQVSAYLVPRGNKADPDALYFVFIGGNDVVLATMTPDDQAADKILHNAVGGIDSAIRRLVAAGAKTIFAPDFIDVGLAPAVRHAPPGVADRASKLSRQYNNEFDAMLDRVETELDFTLVRWSFGDFVDSTYRHADELGFTNVSDSCVAMTAPAICDFNRFVFFDEVYPTAKVHELVGSAMALAVLQRDIPDHYKMRAAISKTHAGP
jgi:phospholipase/lecithinase/hemolysin